MILSHCFDPGSIALARLGSRAGWFESVPERTNAKDPAPLKVKEVRVKERRYIICLNEVRAP